MKKLATFAGGCFWCMFKPFSNYEGIEKIVAGYTGGEDENPNYEKVCQEITGHLEAIQLTYDDELVNYEDLLNIFWKQIDPTDTGGQFNDRGNRYKTAIFYHDDIQKELALKSKKELEESNLFENPIVTKILPAQTFYIAEEYHQDYYKKEPIHYEMYYKGSGRYDFIKTHWDKNNKDRENLKSK